MKKQEEEFKLKEKIDYIGDNFGFPIKAVEEFIRLLKDDCSFCILKEDERFMLKQIKSRSGGL